MYMFFLQADVLALVDAFDQLGNPFMEDSGDLIDLDQSIIMPPDVVENVRKVKDIGRTEIPGIPGNTNHLSTGSIHSNYTKH